MSGTRYTYDNPPTIDEMRAVLAARPLLCVIDFEATCWEDRKIPGPNGRGWVEPRSEIIEFGCVLVRSDTLKQVSMFQSFVRPKLNPTLSDFCKALTSISQKDIDRESDGFIGVLARFNVWLDAMSPSRDSITFGSWGFYDRNQLMSDCELHGVPYPFTGEHLNIKLYIGQKLWGGKGVGISKAATRLGIPFEGTPHRGIDDARMICKIMRAAEGK